MATDFQGKVIRALNDVDQQNMDLLDQVIDAANEVASGDTANVTIDEPQPEGPGDVSPGEMQRWDTIVGGGDVPPGETQRWDTIVGGGEVPPGEMQRRDTIVGGGQGASTAGTGGVALLEFAKDAIQTAASNISGAGTEEIQARKIAERKMESADEAADDDDDEKK